MPHIPEQDPGYEEHVVELIGKNYGWPEPSNGVVGFVSLVGNFDEVQGQGDWVGLGHVVWKSVNLQAVYVLRNVLRSELSLTGVNIAPYLAQIYCVPTSLGYIAIRFCLGPGTREIPR